MFDMPINLTEETPSELLARIMSCIGAAFRYQRDWSLPTTPGEPLRLLPFERRTLARMVSRVEHMIRCWIILLTFVYMRDHTAPPRPWTLPLTPPARTPRKVSAEERAILQKRKPVPGAFRISLPSEKTTRRNRAASKGTSLPKRRSDQINATLDMRLKRLFTLLDEADDRARRLASVWQGRAAAIRRQPPANRTVPDPLKGSAPPADLLQNAEPDEAADLRQWHKIGTIAAQGFYALCGRTRS